MSLLCHVNKAMLTWFFFYSTAEIEDISSRLKTSRQRVGDLERSLATVNNSSQQFEKVRRPSDMNAAFNMQCIKQSKLFWEEKVQGRENF